MSTPAFSNNKQRLSQVQGTISFDKTCHVKKNKKIKVIVKLLDVSIQDALSKTIAYHERYIFQCRSLEFVIQYSKNDIDNKNIYAVAAEAYIDTGEHKKEDRFVKTYITTQSYPVITHGHPSRVDLIVNSIK
jgi:uncharacterized lipoprotein YbaY